MGHGQHMHGAYAATGGPDTLLLLLLAVAVVAGVGLLIWWLSSRRRLEASPEEAAQEGIRRNLDGQILAMLHQAGGGLTQVEIRDALDMPVSEVAAALRDLQERGGIVRQWDVGRYTFVVQTAMAHA